MSPSRPCPAFVATFLGCVALCCPLPSFAAAQPALDPGGVSVDLRGLGQVAVTGPEMLVNGGMEQAGPEGLPAGWMKSSYVWMPVDDPPRREAMLQRIQPLMQYEWSADDAARGKHCARLAMPPQAFNPEDPKGHEFCAIFHQHVVLAPLQRDTKYVLNYSHRGHSDTSVPNSRPYVRITFYDHEDPLQGKQTRVYAQTIFSSSAQWRRGQLEFSTPQATRCLDVRIALTGVGEISFDDVSLRLAELQESGPAARLMPGTLVDNRFCLSQGDVGTMAFGFRNEDSRPLGKPQLALELPADVAILTTAPTAPIAAQTPVGDAIQYRLDLAALKHRIHDASFPYPFNQWEGLQVLVRTERAPADQPIACRYWLEDGDYRSPELSFDLQIVPALPTVQGPARFRSGAHLFLLTGLTDPQAIEAFVKLYRQVGFNCVHVPASPLGTALGQAGIERYAQPMANGYTIYTPEPKPDEVVFRLADGKARPEAICPVEVYTKGPFFREKVVGMLRKLLVTDRQAEQLMCNWEPGVYAGQGCFCDRCRAEFAAYSKLPAAEVERVWPKSVIQEHGDLWLKFRSWQHGKLMVTLEETAQELGREAGREIHFIPELHFGLLTDTWDKYAGNAEFAPTEYLAKLPVLNSWAPYNWYVFGRGPYEYIRGRHLDCLVTAEEVRRNLAERYPRVRHRLFAFPYGTYEGVTEPEAIAFEVMTYFVEGYEGAIVYLFPGGSDARYWRALAKMNRGLSICDKYVSGSPVTPQHAVTPVTPLPQPDDRFLAQCGILARPERWRDISLLQSREHRQGQTRLIAVGNFWERGECFFRLSVKGLPAGGKYVLREPAAGRLYANSGGQTALSATELAKGVLMHVGALRWGFYVIEPLKPGPDGAIRMTAQAMAAEMQRRLPAIQAACQEAE